MIVVYTYWRVAEVFMLHQGLDMDRNGPLERRAGEILTGITAVLASML